MYDNVKILTSSPQPSWAEEQTATSGSSYSLTSFRKHES